MAHILLADDDEVSTFLLLKAIEKSRSPINLEVVRNGDDALKYIIQKGSPELLLLDLNMPVLNGTEFLMEARSQNIVIPYICVISTYIRKERKAELHELGCKCFMEKPITEEKLNDLIQTIPSSKDHTFNRI